LYRTVAKLYWASWPRQGGTAHDLVYRPQASIQTNTYSTSHFRFENKNVFSFAVPQYMSTHKHLHKPWYLSQRRIQAGTRGHAFPNHQRFFSKVRFLMSFQIFLDSIIDLSNETITFIMPCIFCSFIRSLNSQYRQSTFSSSVSQLI